MIPPVATTAPYPAEQARLREAGTAFEALILQQMLAGIMPAGTPAADLATQALARDLAEASPFGIARLLETRA